MMTIGERIKVVRASEGLSLDKFGERIGLKKSTLSQIENCKANVTERVIKDVCDKFHIDEIWLRTGDGKMHLDVTRREAVADFLAEILSGGGTPEQIAFISVIAKTTPEQWKLFRAKLAELNSEISLAEKENGENTE